MVDTAGSWQLSIARGPLALIALISAVIAFLARIARASYPRAADVSFAERKKETLLPFRPPSSLPSALPMVVDEYRKTKLASRHTAIRGREIKIHMRAPANTALGKGTTFLSLSLSLSLSFSLSLSLSLSYFLSRTHHTHVHPLFHLFLSSRSPAFSASVFLSSLLFRFLSISCFLSLPLFPRRRGTSMARSRPPLETAHSAMPFVTPLDDDRPLRHRESTLTTAVVLLAKDQVRPANVTESS